MRDLVGPPPCATRIREIRCSPRYPSASPRVAHPFLSRLASPRLAGVVRHGALASLASPWRRTSASSSAAGRVVWRRVAAVAAAHVAPLIVARAERRREKRAPRRHVRRGRRGSPASRDVPSPLAEPSAPHGSPFPVRSLSIPFLRFGPRRCPPSEFSPARRVLGRGRSGRNASPPDPQCFRSRR